MSAVAMLFMLGGCMDFDLKGVEEPEAEGLRDLAVDPGLVDFGTLTDGTPVTDTVTLTAVGELPVTVSAIDISGSTAFTITWTSGETTLEPGASADVVVTYTPASFEDRGQLVVRSDAVEPDQAVTLMGAGLYPAILITPASAYFLSEYGETVEQDLVVSSVGTADLDLSDLLVQGAQFSAEGTLPPSLSPGETTTLTVSYAPEVEGETALGKLWLTTNTTLGYAMVPLEGRQGPPCLGLGEAWDRGLLAAHTLDGGTLEVENRSPDEEVCIDQWYVWLSEESQDMGVGDMDADFGDIYPTGSLGIAPLDALQFVSASASGASWWCLEATQYTQARKDYEFIGARVPEPLLTSMLGRDQEAVWEWEAENPVILAARRTHYVEMPEGGATAPVTLRVLNMGGRGATAEVRETVPAGYTATGFSRAPARTEEGADGATVYVFEVSLVARIETGMYAHTIYDELDITYTLGVPACRGRQYLPPMETRWEDSGGDARVGTANPLVINCE